MTVAEDGLIYPHPTPEWDQPVEIAPGLYWLRTRLPFALDHINIWLIDDGEAWTLIDTGVGDAATRTLWERLLATLLAAKPVARVLATHFHPDHLGQAGWLCERTGAPLVTTRTEWLMAKALSLDDSEAFLLAGEGFDRQAGLDEELVRQRRARGNLYRPSVAPVPASFQRLVAGDRLLLGGGEWRVIIGEGHAPELVTLYSAERRILIAADQVLPRISPVIGVWPQTPDADPLTDFLRSLGQYRELPDDCLVLPSHGLPFRGLKARLASLASHHDGRLARTLEILESPHSAVETAHRLFTRPLGPADIGFAMVETIAHLNCLRQRGLVRREPATDGIWRYHRA